MRTVVVFRPMYRILPLASTRHSGRQGRTGRLAFFIFFCRNDTILNVTPYRGSLKVKLAFDLAWLWALLRMGIASQLDIAVSWFVGGQ